VTQPAVRGDAGCHAGPPGPGTLGPGHRASCRHGPVGPACRRGLPQDYYDGKWVILRVARARPGALCVAAVPELTRTVAAHVEGGDFCRASRRGCRDAKFDSESLYRKSEKADSLYSLQTGQLTLSYYDVL
jgi:hypothetical protein